MGCASSQRHAEDLKNPVSIESIPITKSTPEERKSKRTAHTFTGSEFKGRVAKSGSNQDAEATVSKEEEAIEIEKKRTSHAYHEGLRPTVAPVVLSLNDDVESRARRMSNLELKFRVDLEKEKIEKERRIQQEKIEKQKKIWEEVILSFMSFSNILFALLLSFACPGSSIITGSI